MKRHFGTFTALCITTLAMVAYFAQVIVAQSLPVQFKAYTHIAVENGTIHVCVDDEVEVKTSNGTVPAKFEADFAVDMDTEQAIGGLRIIYLLTNEPQVFEVIGGTFEFGTNGVVEGFQLDLKTPDGELATADGSSADDDDNTSSGSRFILWDII